MMVLLLLLLLLKGQHRHPSARVSEKERDSQDRLNHAMKRGDSFFAPKLTPHPFSRHTVNSRAKRCGAAST